MTPFELKDSLKTIKLLVDTREQPTERYEHRLKLTGFPYERRKLDVGDYSCECTLSDGSIYSLADKAVIERKMNIEELCMCFGRERKRFEAEFERAKQIGIKIYLLVENGSWEKIYANHYKSLMSVPSIVASINAFRARYGMELDFCKSETTGLLIRDILYRELKERLEAM